MDKKDMDFKPVNINERLLYGCMIRLDALCDMVNSIVEYIAAKDSIATTSNEVVAPIEEEVATPIEEEVVVKPAPKRVKKKK